MAKLANAASSGGRSKRKKTPSGGMHAAYEVLRLVSVKHKIKTLRGYFVKEMKKEGSRTSSCSYTSRWKHFKCCEFLRGTISVDASSQPTSAAGMSYPADTDVGSLTGERTGISFLVGNMLFFLTSSSIVAGLGLGFLTRNTEGAWTRRHISYMAFPGEIFLRLAGVVVIPLLTSMLVASIATAGLAAARRVGLLAFTFYVVSKAMAMAVAYALAVSLNPGNPARRIDVTDVRPTRGRTHYVNIVFDAYISLESQTPVIRRTNIPNYMGMTIVSVLLGAVLAILCESCRGFIELFVAVNDVMLNLGQLIMWYFPIGICFLLTSQTLRSHEFVSETRQLETYFLSLVLALAIHGMLTLPALLVLFSRTHYRSLFSNIGLTLVTAFGTSSSNMTLTSTVSSLEGKVGLHPLVVRLVAPLGATFNKDGTAIYMAINTVFFAQRSGYHITFFDVLATSTVTLIMSSATAAMPGQNETCIVLTTRLLGLSSQSVGVLVLSDWITDRLATVVNVLGDAVCCCIIDERCKNVLPGTSEKFSMVPTKNSRHERAGSSP
ncbi:excitatory amino acid transporter [Dermacentor silvarum]|nr:excitatory amino acid transporter [Dermacentor silvarum]